LQRNLARKLLAFTLLFTVSAVALRLAPAQSHPLQIISPEVHPDQTVTFRLLAPNAKEVALQLEGASGSMPMQKDDQGIWTITTAPLSPDYYGYSYKVDGVAGVLDPSNYRVKPNFLNRANEVHVPGPPFLSWEVADVPHGEIHHHFYKSAIVGDQRDYYIYTPPKYDPHAKQTYPVLYLLHGYSDDASAWTAVGRANVILDNLIAQGKAKPMLVVMPLGYGEPKVLEPHSGVFENPGITQRNFDKFREALIREVIPRVESAYLVKKDRDSRAIAGLSMGGSESLLTGLNTLDKFSWIGAFSFGGITPEFDKEFAALDSKANSQLHLLWIACGTEDHLIEINRNLRAWLGSKSIKHVDIETPGAHTWMVWRRNLSDFTTLLFR
jgi:enterochelin esterase-like enzyme